MFHSLSNALRHHPRKTAPFDSCQSRCIGINKIYILNPTTVVKLLQYSGSRVEHRDEFSLHKCFAVRFKNGEFQFGFLRFAKNKGDGWCRLKIK